MSDKPKLGFIGLGAMGLPMVQNLLQAGYGVCAFDLDHEKLEASVAAGATTVNDIPELVHESDWVLTSLPSSDAFVTVAEQELLPQAKKGQVFIDLGTVTPPEARRLAKLFKDAGATLLEAPVSGGPRGAARADLYIFAGGDEEVFTTCKPLLEVLGNKITYCGPSGSGQIVKGVNQLMMGLGAAAYLEAMAFGVNAGVDAGVIQRALGNTGRWRQDFHEVATRVVQGNGEQGGVKFRELPYFLQEAQEQGFSLPLTQTLYDFCDAGERVVVDDNRPAPSFWRQLTLEKPMPRAKAPNP